MWVNFMLSVLTKTYIYQRDRNRPLDFMDILYIYIYMDMCAYLQIY